MQGPTAPLGIHVDVEALRGRLRAMTDEQLLAFGKQMRDLVYPLTYDFRGKPSVSAFSIQLGEARAEWRKRHPKATLTDRAAWRSIGWRYLRK